MAFTKPSSRTPTTIGDLQIILKDVVAHDADPAKQIIHYQFKVYDQNGQEMSLPVDTGNLEPHLTAQQVTQLKGFMTTIRNKIVAELVN